ncbi:MAG: hypothetical protein QXE90_01650 [Candidatus Micrarchaeia archaeon]
MEKEWFDEIKEMCQRIKEENSKVIKESKQLIKRAEIMQKFLKRKIQQDQKIMEMNIENLSKNPERYISELRSNNLSKRREAVSELTRIAKTTKNKEELYLIREMLAEELKKESELAEDILTAFFELHLSQNYCAPIVWAAKSHPSEEIREIATLMLIEISKIEKINEKEDWKKRFKEKIKRYRERTEAYNGFKKEINQTPSEEALLRFSNKLIDILTEFVSLNSMIDSNIVKKKLNDVIDLRTVEKISKAAEGKIEMINLLNIYNASISISILLLSGKNLEEKKDGINSNIEKELTKVGKKEEKVTDWINENKQKTRDDGKENQM